MGVSDHPRLWWPFVRPTILLDVQPRSEIWKTEVFGPVLGVMHVETIDQAIELTNSHLYGNQASLFTSSGAAARKFRYEAEAGNIGINIGVAAPMAFFPFSGWKESFFGDLWGWMRWIFHPKKVVVERWPKDWSRKFWQKVITDAKLQRRPCLFSQWLEIIKRTHRLDDS
jgi:malonate-semialdehyde dehydrogenase (acetylating)/methylmalonate-semialdehyde dehydrogenase